MADIVRRGDYPLTGWDPFRAMREMLRWDPFVRHSFFREPLSWLARGERDVWAPMFEVRENGSAIKLVADLPGVKKEDLDVSIMGNTLTVSGKREAEEQTNDEQFHTYERSFGQFSRSFTLPEYADLEHITSNLSEGVLTIAIPKSAQSKSRKIAIGEASAKA
jgi:HSP20 family protein